MLLVSVEHLIALLTFQHSQPPPGAQNVSCLEFCDRDICLKNWAVLSTFKPHLSVSIQQKSKQMQFLIPAKPLIFISQ